MITVKNTLCKFRLGDRLESFLEFITFGNSHIIAYRIARFLGFKDCGCEKRRIWLNKLTCKDYQDE